MEARGACYNCRDRDAYPTLTQRNTLEWRGFFACKKLHDQALLNVSSHFGCLVPMTSKTTWNHHRVETGYVLVYSSTPIPRKPGISVEAMQTRATCQAWADLDVWFAGCLLALCSFFGGVVSWKLETCSTADLGSTREGIEFTGCKWDLWLPQTPLPSRGTAPLDAKLARR